MNKIITSFKINERVIPVAVESEIIAPGENIVQFDQDESPVKHAAWQKEGYVKIPFLSPDENSLIKASIKSILKKYLIECNINVDGFELDQYHRYVDLTQHLYIMDKIRAGSKGIGGIPFDLLPIKTSRLDEVVSKACNTKVTCTKTFDIGNGEQYTVKHFFIRVVRPGTDKDNNPPHKDTHIDRLRGAVNLYYPIVGSDINSSLPVLPGSHLWPEIEIVRSAGKTVVNGVTYNVPAIVATARGLSLITPNPGEDEALLFTPYAIHGGGINFNENKTRISLEIRFWKD